MKCCESKTSDKLDGSDSVTSIALMTSTISKAKKPTKAVLCICVVGSYLPYLIIKDRRRSFRQSPLLLHVMN